MNRYNLDHYRKNVFESPAGKYVKYEDVHNLIQFLKDKIKEWEDYGLSLCENDGEPEDYSECAYQLKRKLQEIGEL